MGVRYGRAVRVRAVLVRAWHDSGRPRRSTSLQVRANRRVSAGAGVGLTADIN